MDDYPNKAKFVDPDWEITTAELVHEMAEDYMRRGMNIPESIIVIILSDVPWRCCSQKLCDNR